MMISPLLLPQVENLVVEAGRYQMSCFRQSGPGAGDEKVAREFVSEVDLKSEERLIDGLTKLLPEAGFYAEESGLSGSQELRWVIDPLDGTTNFLSGLDQFSISVALQEAEKPVLGVVYRPASGELFSAVKGQGVQCNGQPCRLPAVSDMSQALIGTGFPYRSADLADNFFRCAAEVLPRCRGLRRLGSAALDVSYVAAGFLQGFWEADLMLYDVAAALLFLQENGCRLSNQRGEAYQPEKDRILVCAPEPVHAQLLEIVARHY